MKDLDKFEAAIDRVNRTLRVVREGDRRDSVQSDFFNSVQSELSGIRDDLRILADSMSKLPKELPQIPEVDFSHLYNKVENLSNAVKSIPQPPEPGERVVEVASPAEIVEVPVIVEKTKLIDVERVVEVSKEPVKRWHFKVIRDGGVITDVEAMADG
jgi:hypothetical protein